MIWTRGPRISLLRLTVGWRLMEVAAIYSGTPYSENSGVTGLVCGCMSWRVRLTYCVVELYLDSFRGFIQFEHDLFYSPTFHIWNTLEKSPVLSSSVLLYGVSSLSCGLSTSIGTDSTIMACNTTNETWSAREWQTGEVTLATHPTKNHLKTESTGLQMPASWSSSITTISLVKLLSSNARFLH